MLAEFLQDLAKAALVERQKAADMAEGMNDEVAQIEAVLRGYEADIAKRLEALRADHAALPRLRAEFEALNKR